jgi:hypothetical protein
MLSPTKESEVEKTTFIIKTRAPRGPRSSSHETFVVVARDAIEAGELAVAVAYPGAVVTSTQAVLSVQRVMVG